MQRRQRLYLLGQICLRMGRWPSEVMGRPAGERAFLEAATIVALEEEAKRTGGWAGAGPPVR